MRFSIRSVFILTAIAAFLSCVFLLLPDGFAYLSLLLIGLMAPTAIVAGIIYSRDYWRAFAIGSLFPSIWIIGFSAYILPLMLATSLSNGENWKNELFGIQNSFGFKLAFLVEFALCVASGLVAVGVRRLCVGRRKQSDQPGPRSDREINEPYTKADLYRIIEGRMQSPIAAKVGGLTSTTADPAFDS